MEYIRAYHWLILAATSGNEQVIKMRDYAASKLSPETRRSVQEVAAETAAGISESK